MFGRCKADELGGVDGFGAVEARVSGIEFNIRTTQSYNDRTVPQSGLTQHLVLSHLWKIISFSKTEHHILLLIISSVNAPHTLLPQAHVHPGIVSRKLHLMRLMDCCAFPLHVKRMIAHSFPRYVFFIRESNRSRICCPRFWMISGESTSLRRTFPLPSRPRDAIGFGCRQVSTPQSPQLSWAVSVGPKT